MTSVTPIYIAHATEHNLLRIALSNYIRNLDSRFVILFEACNGKDLISKIEGCVIQPDICIFDVKMTELNGYETIQQVKKDFPFVKCIVLSNVNVDFCISTAIRIGALGYLTRNAEPHEIKDAILQVLENKCYFSSDINCKHHGVFNFSFNDREIEFLAWCSSDLSYTEIAEKMHLGKRTVENYCLKLRNKLNIDSRVGLALFAAYVGIARINSFTEITNTIITSFSDVKLV